MADLRAWVEATAAISVRVLVGAGGRGKTRLALELARDIAKDGWLAGFVTADELSRFRKDGGTDRWRWDKPVLIILDYAASRADQLRAWFRELVDASVEGRARLARDGDPEPIAFEETDTSFQIAWPGGYRLDGPALVYTDHHSRRVSTILGYPRHLLATD